ncbi:MAG: NAD(P)-dependent glycerol-3-phosphate dehydrogenase [Candidatus Aminicenantes bacterium]|nr:NAD(P)-dependent glycerol-3-phosphate dehydrogenase [Candidatus Aminicenantes bacterium]
MIATVIGGGSWGTAFALHLGRLGIPTRLWVREDDVRREIAERGTNSLFLPGFRLSGPVSVFGDPAEALANGEIVFVAVPSQFFRRVAETMAPHLGAARGIVSLTKGIEDGSLRRMSEVIEDIMGRSGRRLPIAALSGPSFAREVAEGRATAVVAASEDRDLVRTVQHLVSDVRFRVYTSSDIRGVELAGAVKNVIAIAVGIADGLDAGRNATAALMTRGLHEMTRLGMRMGARAETFAGLAGIGDLILTCTGALSRNRYVGSELGRGRSLESITSGMAMIAEGIVTTLSVRALADRFRVELPICQQVYEVLYRGKPIDRILDDLMSRSLKSEHGDVAAAEKE